MSGTPLAAASKGLILAVDDQAENLELLEEILGAQGYEVALATDGEKAMAAVDARPPDCIVLDIMMPRMDGYEVCGRLKGDPRTQFIPIIMLTALAGVSEKVKGLEAGADDFLNKPVRREELLARVRSLVRIKRLRDELDTSESVIFTMVRALESKDATNAGHSEHVAAAAMAVARRMNLSVAERDAVVKGALLHDIGNLGLADELLCAPRPLDAEQEALYRKHPELGEKMLLPLRSLSAARDVVRHHHERVDGSGYPDGLYGSEISRPAQIVGIANAYVGLRHDDGLSPAAAAERLKEDGKAGRFAPDVVEMFLETGAAVVGERGDAPPDAWSELIPSNELVRTGTVLIGDDTASNREMLMEILGASGFSTIAVSDGPSVLAAVEDAPPDLILLDVRMPGLDGFEVCRRLKSDRETEFIPVVLMTAFRDARDRMRGIEIGADDFLSLPVNRLELAARVRSLLRLRTYHRDLEDHESVVLSLASILEAKDPYTRGHSARVADLAFRVAESLALPTEECERLRVAGLLHDIGKVGVPGWVMNKPGALTADELLTVLSHGPEGESLCRPLKSIQAILPIIRHHHERFDGGGYPDHLRGDEIPLGARLLALCDAYDALTSDRAYRKSLPSQEAMGTLERETEAGRWDPRLFRALAGVVQAAPPSS